MENSENIKNHNKMMGKESLAKEDNDVVKQFNYIKKEYKSFILTSICRQNEKLKSEINNIFNENDLLQKDLILQLLPEYERQFDFKQSNFSENFNRFLLSDDFKKLNKGKEFVPYKHQAEAWKKINNGENCIISTGTGSGKTESFFFPIIDKILNNDNGKIQSIIIYPLKALTNDQGKRLGKYLDGINEFFSSNITYGILDGDTPKNLDTKNYRHRENSGNKSEMYTREDILNKNPRILLTNYVILERILLNPKYKNILNKMDLKFVVLDELHYYRGAQGIDVSLLLRRFTYFMRKINCVKNIQWIGTSATLGNDFEKLFNFLKNIFNMSFNEDQIVTPFYDKDFLDKELADPKFFSEIKNFNNERVRSHAFFCSPPSFYRCLSCGKLHYSQKEGGDKEYCDCESNLIFEIATCRQCGEEYFIYPAKENNIKTGLTFSKIAREDNHCIEFSKKDEEKIKEIILSRKKLKNSKTLRMCTNCLNLFADGVNGGDCNCCDFPKYHLVYSVDKEIETLLQGNENKKFCPHCEFDNKKQDLIVPTSKLSDENCSHIVFEELFMSLPEDNRRLLIFTDSVQRSSKFARDIEDTHLKNIAKAELEKYIKTLNSAEDLNEIIHRVTKNMNIERFKEKQKDGIKKELYEEILGNGKKVASLANRNLFNLKFNLNQCLDEKKELVRDIFKEFVKRNNVTGYYNILVKEHHKEEDTLPYLPFSKREDIIKAVYRIVNNVKMIKKKDEIKYFETENLLKSIEGIYEKDDNFFLGDDFILIEKNEIQNNNKNYYSKWTDFERIPSLLSNVDNGKNNAKERGDREREFNKSPEKLNVLVATPTLELGIDIIGLDVVGLLYAPPSAAQYSQRIGRAGRENRSSLSVSYLSKSTLDRMYFFEPKKIVKGNISPPPFKINLEIPIKKALFSLFLYCLLNNEKFKDIFARKDEWSDPNNWEKHIEKITVFFKDSENEFKTFFADFFAENEFFEIHSREVVNEWIRKLQKFVNERVNLKKVCKRFNYRDKLDIFSYLQKAGLLPDYAFGSGGSILSIGKMSGYENIEGYGLKYLCPPSIINHNKKIYKANGIFTGEYSKVFNDLVLSGKYQCLKCNVIFDSNIGHCPCCGQEIRSLPDVINPRIIRGKETSFSIQKKWIKPEYKIKIDMLDVKFYNGITEPCEGDIYKIYEKYNVGSKEGGNIMFKKDGIFTEKRKEKGFDEIIGESFKTRLLLLDLKQLDISTDSLTFLNALISSLTVLSGCEDGEIQGEKLGDSGKMLLFDNIEGGVGYVDLLYNDRLKVFEEMKKLCEMDCCESGCPACIGSYWRKHELGSLDKKKLKKELDEYLKRKLLK